VTLPSIDPSKIIWIKSVDRGDTSLWAYCGEDPTTRHFEPEREGDEFDLHWPTRMRWNVQGPQRGDLICLTQAMHVSHLVEVVDDGPHERPPEHIRPRSRDPHYAIARTVRALVIRGKGLAPHYDQALEFAPRLQGGPCCLIEGLKPFRKSPWPSKGGLRALQRHLVGVLGGTTS
jgi:hypothetical protein